MVHQDEWVENEIENLKVLTSAMDFSRYVYTRRYSKCHFKIMEETEKGSKEVMRKQNNGKNILKYTDDTAMARQVALSLIDKKGLDITDMAKRFVDENTNEPWRGYGQSVGEVFRKLSKTNFASEETVFRPAAEQFDGSGSYGNGAAMRAHPVGLFGKNQTEVEEIATKQARLTHSNDEGVVGSILQATGILYPNMSFA